MSIGTAKPTQAQLNEVQHFFINNKSINELYGAGHFEKDAIALLNELFKQFSVVIMVGGSGLYIDAVLNGVDDFVEVPMKVREELNKQFEEKGLVWLQNEVRKNDEVYFNSVDINNPQRLIRALEVSLHTGIPYSSYLKKIKAERNFTPVKILINTNREKLYTQINRRVDEMMNNGLLQEAEQYKEQRNFNALKTVGYKELYDYFDGKYNLETAIEKIKQHTRNYAKRQITWFKNKDKFTEFEPNEKEKIIYFIDKTINFERDF